MDYKLALVLNASDIDYFTRWALLDVASRAPARRQTKSLAGVWRGYCLGGQKARGSDLRARRFTCIYVMHCLSGRDIETAARAVGEILGITTAKGGDSIRADYYNFSAKTSTEERSWHVNSFISQFLGWRDWVLGASIDDVHFAVRLCRETKPDAVVKVGPRWARSRPKEVWALIDDIRRDPTQAEANRKYLEARVEQLQSLRGDDPLTEAQRLGGVGSLYQQLGRLQEAASAYSEALERWRSTEDSHIRNAIIAKLEDHVLSLRRA